MREPRPGRFIIRAHLWLTALEPWECPGGHRLATNAAVIEHDALICQQRADRGAGECGKRVWVRKYPDGQKYVAEISVAEYQHLRQTPMTAEAVMVFLSGAPPREQIA